jgi:signal recognition particle subunit SRP54
MFESLSRRLSSTVDRLRGQGRLTEENIKDTLREVRMALLEADVALPVVREFVDRVRERAVGVEVTRSLSPGQAFVKIVNDELVAIMGEANEGLELKVQPPAVVLLAGLQGAGKTTTVGKLARYLKDKAGKKVMVVSADVYRPAAIEQLRSLAEQVGVEFVPSSTEEPAEAIVRRALEQARRQFADVLLIDTAGRLHIDDAMMAEIQRVHTAANPVETLFVVDSMTGQDAANAARAFGDALPLTGVILTKTDGDARGGAALSVRQVTGKPIKFLGAGEKLDALEPFHPERVASRILGMGDVLSLVEEVEAKVDQEKARKLAQKVRKGKGFDLEDLRDQFQQMQSLGGMAALLDKLPGLGKLPDAVKSQTGEPEIRRMVAIIDSMTPHERRFPDVINGSRKRRIAGGSGTQVQDINRLLKQYKQMRKMMKKMGKGGMASMMRNMGRGGGLPGMRP